MSTTLTRALNREKDKTEDQEVAKKRLALEKEGFKAEWMMPEPSPQRIPKPAGAYVLIKLCIPDEGLDRVEYPTLNQMNFRYLSEDQKKRETLSGDVGRVIAIGPTAFKGLQYGEVNSAKEWGVKVGDLIQVAGRYQGTNIENALTRALGIVLREIDDNLIIGVYKED